MKPERIQLSRRKGFRLQEASMALNGLPAVKVDRATMWGNPFPVGKPSGYLFKDGGDPTPIIAALSLEQSLGYFRSVLGGFLCPEMHPYGHEWWEAFHRRTRGWHPREAARSLLAGKNLACWCPLPKPGEPDLCHAAVLLEMANRPTCEEAAGRALAQGDAE